jgi:hypothetical protein
MHVAYQPKPRPLAKLGCASLLLSSPIVSSLPHPPHSPQPHSPLRSMNTLGNPLETSMSIESREIRD